MTAKSADILLAAAAKTDARRHVPYGTLIHPLVPPNGWEELRPLIELRVSLGIQQGEIAGAANATPSMINSLERGRRKITRYWIYKYGEALKACERALKERRREDARQTIDTTLPWVKAQIGGGDS